MKIAAAVMAGGSGERFWPLSKKSRPKQFLSLLGGQSMIRQTVNRLGELVRPEDIYVVTLQEYKGMIMEELPSISGDRILVEPCGKDTAELEEGLKAIETAPDEERKDRAQDIKKLINRLQLEGYEDSI